MREMVTSVTKLDDFKKFLPTNFHTKVAQIFGDIFGYFESINFLKKKLLELL